MTRTPLGDEIDRLRTQRSATWRPHTEQPAQIPVTALIAVADPAVSIAIRQMAHSLRQTPGKLFNAEEKQ
jgi:hypothetical protein